MWKGIDVSDNQGVISWEKVAGAGCQFAILRSVKRSGKPDGQFEANVSGCLTNGLQFEVYKYTYASVPYRAAEEAKQVVDLLHRYQLSCRIWWDVEDTSLKKAGTGVLTGLIQSARNMVEGAGMEFGIYTGLSFYNEGYFDASAFDCPFWIARYPAGASYPFSSEPPSDRYCPQIAQTLAAWQYTSRGRVNGISGDVDLNIRYLPL